MLLAKKIYFALSFTNTLRKLKNNVNKGERFLFFLKIKFNSMMKSRDLLLRLILLEHFIVNSV